MDVKEINTILQYKRPCDSWLCPECVTEYNVSLGKCAVCGCRVMGFSFSFGDICI